MPVAVLKQPFDHPDYLFEVKYDGFRSLTYIEAGKCRLFSRNGNCFSRFIKLAGATAGAIPGRRTHSRRHFTMKALTSDSVSTRTAPGHSPGANPFCSL